MLEKNKLKFYRFLTAILLVVMLSMSGVMYVSAHGGDVTLIHACVTNRTGALRIVSATTTCDVRETPLDWGIQGPKGDKGDVGPIGLQGPQGEQGPAGPGIGFSQGAVSFAGITLNPGQTVYSPILDDGLGIIGPIFLSVSYPTSSHFRSFNPSATGISLALEVYETESPGRFRIGVTNTSGGEISDFEIRWIALAP